MASRWVAPVATGVVPRYTIQPFTSRFVRRLAGNSPARDEIAADELARRRRPGSRVAATRRGAVARDAQAPRHAGNGEAGPRPTAAASAAVTASGRNRNPSAESPPTACHGCGLQGLQGMSSPHRLQRRVSSESSAPTTIDRASMRSSGRRHRRCRRASSPADVLTRTPSTPRSSSITIRRCCFLGSRVMFVPARKRILPRAATPRRYRYAAGDLTGIRYRALGS